MKKSPNRLVLAALALITAAVFVVPVLTEIEIPVFRTLEQKSHDLRFLIRGKTKPTGKVVIVAIDDRSIEAMGRWPWPRFVLAKLIEILKDANAKAIGVDLIFSEREQVPEFDRINTLISSYTELGLLNSNPENQAFFEEMAELAESADNDALLSEISRRSQNVIHTMAFVPVERIPEIPMPYLRKSTLPQSATDEIRPDTFQGGIFPISIIGESADRLGFANVIPDSDGAVRLGAAVLKVGGNSYTSLPICSALRYLDVENNQISYDETGEFSAGQNRIPIDGKGRFFINYYGPEHTFTHYSFVDVLAGNIPPGKFADKCVFVGGAAVGLGDHWAAPFTGKFWGVELQATIADNVLSQRFYSRPSWVKYADALSILILGCVATAILARLPILLCPPFSAMLMLIFAAWNQYVFNRHGYILSYVWPLMAIGVATAGVCLFRYMTEVRENRILKGALVQYLNPGVVGRILKNPECLMLGGDKKDLSVLFSDIRGFTSISESLDPEVLVRLMNRYLTQMTDVVMDNEGTLDKYIGDAVMAFFGAPEDQEDHSVRACRTALAMVETLYVEREKWKAEGFPEILVGIGINTGDMVVGNMGSEKRFDYTVIGDQVNLAARLEGLTKMYGVKILVSEFTRERAGDNFVFREIDLVCVKGKNRPVKIYELVGRDYFTGGEYAYIPPFEEGVRAYRKREFEKAIDCFEKTLSLKPGDFAAAVYIGRSRDLMLNPPGESWNGVYVARTK